MPPCFSVVWTSPLDNSSDRESQSRTWLTMKDEQFKLCVLVSPRRVTPSPTTNISNLFKIFPDYFFHQKLQFFCGKSSYEFCCLFLAEFSIERWTTIFQSSLGCKPLHLIEAEQNKLQRKARAYFRGIFYEQGALYCFQVFFPANFCSQPTSSYWLIIIMIPSPSISKASKQALSSGVLLSYSPLTSYISGKSEKSPFWHGQNPAGHGLPYFVFGLRTSL